MLAIQHFWSRDVPAFTYHLGRLATLAFLAATVSQTLTRANDQAGLGSTPSLYYFRGIQELYEGDYRDAARTFRREARGGSIKIGVTGRWIDSIAYHAMWGEVLYHQGLPEQALEEFNHACALFLENPRWLLKVNFRQQPRPDISRARRPIPWGQSGRQFTLGSLPRQMLISQGDLQSGNRAVQRGGVVQAAQMWKINVVEIIRATALAIRRRNELLGPLAKHDAISREIIAKLSGAAPPNHWSNAWVDLQLGIAYAGQGELDQARKRLARAERLAGKFDHQLTCVALLELGRLELESGNFDSALRYLAEASFSAFYYEDPGVIDEAFRLRAIARQVAPQKNIDPMLELAASWARRERYQHIYSRLCFAMTEEMMNVGNWSEAAAMLSTGQSRMRDARTGLLGNWSQYLEARLLYQQGHDSAANVLAQAVDRQMALAPRNLQIAIANRRYVQQRLRSRSAVNVYQTLLADPTPADWVVRPLQTLAYMKTPHDQAFDYWLDAQFANKAAGTALEITDLAKRRRYHRQLAFGGKLAALRNTLEASETVFNPERQNRRSNLMLRYPGYAESLKAGLQLRAKLQANWHEGLDEHAQRELTKVWRNWSTSIANREALLQRISLERVSTDLQFPPFLATTALQSKLKPGQAVAVFHTTANGLLGFLVTSNASTHWNCGPMGRLAGPLNNFLRELGNYDANHSLTSEQLTSTKWLATGNKLFNALFAGSSIDPEAITELVVVPDGLVWYVPFTALPVKLEARTTPLISLTKLRVVPTMSLAYGQTIPWRRIQRSALVGQAIAPGDTDEERSEAVETLREALSNPIELPSPSPIATPLVGSLLDTLVVLNEINIDPNQPLAWSLLSQGRSSRQDALNQWLMLPQFGPQRLILPGIHTIAERGGKTSKRKATLARPGEELFLASCGLMSTGAQTILLSRWRVGGQSTLDLMREFIQELPHTTAADSWQRSVQLAQELPIDPTMELRVKNHKDAPPLTAGHPFFWGGYLLIDAGVPGPENTTNEKKNKTESTSEENKIAVEGGKNQTPEKPKPRVPEAKP